GTSWTTASRRPRIRLTSVDLPTLGRPTTATTGGGPAASPSIGSANSADSQSLSSLHVPSWLMWATPRCRLGRHHRRRRGSPDRLASLLYQPQHVAVHLAF